jgi:cell division protein FtsB
MKLRRVVPFLALIVLIGLLFVGVFPTRTWLAQRKESAAATEQLHVLNTENTRLAARVKALQSDDEIERLAREQYNLVKPGEEAYALLPGQAPTPKAAPTPAAAKSERDQSLPSKVWHTLTDWL